MNQTWWTSDNAWCTDDKYWISIQSVMMANFMLSILIFSKLPKSVQKYGGEVVEVLQ